MSDIAGYLKQHEEKPLLRFITCGSVDDGKSTLIGRLLYDSKRLVDDQLAAHSAHSKRHGTQGETPMLKKVRFRTLGCYPLTGAIESEADTLEAIIAEMLVATSSERQGRVIDQDPTASMEKKKLEGYF